MVKRYFSETNISLMARFTGLIGICVILAIAFLFSSNRKKINPQIVVSGLLIQVIIAFLVKEVNKLDLEVCCTLGMLSEHQAQKLTEAGLYAYNHNLDTSEDNYSSIITTRQYDDRLNTISNVRKAGITVCSGGIIGLGETDDDRIGMLHTLAHLDPQPESVPINALVAVKGTPMENQERVPFWEMVRMVATARIVLPKAAVRLSAGRLEMSMSEQALCFLAGANSIFAGDKLLTTPNPEFNEDLKMFEILGITPKKAFQDQPNFSRQQAVMND